MAWKLVKTVAVGGLVNIGFVENSNLLLVVSHSGQGIFDCLTGEKIARNYDDFWEFFDAETGQVKGFDILESQIIQTHGLIGEDKLLAETTDGWALQVKGEGGCSEIVLVSPDNRQQVVGNDEVVEIKAFGFSQSERFFVFPFLQEIRRA